MKSFYKVFILFVATGAFTGYIPFAPGTFGSMLGIVVYYFAVRTLNIYESLILLIVIILVGTYSAGKAEIFLNEEDSSKIVIDEIAGMYITLFLIPFNLVNIVIAFICFRVLDISKPYLISYADKHVHGGIGIMLDDIIGGVSANIIVRLLIFFLEVISGKPL